MSILQADLKILYAESGGVCAFPKCGRRVLESATEADEAVLIAHTAHIVGESPDGPRGKSSLTLHERNRHTNLLVLCTEHHTVVDGQPNTYTVAVLQQMKLDHKLRILKATSGKIPDSSTRVSSEKVFSTLLPVRECPSVVFAAPCDLPDGQDEEIRSALKYPQNRWEIVPFLLKERTVFTFHDLADPGNPFRNTIDYSKARSIPTKEFWSSPEGQRRFVTLLNRALYKYTARLNVRFDPDHRRFYFYPKKAGIARSVPYRTAMNKRTNRKVVWRPITRFTGEPKSHWLHLAAALRFHRVSEEQWCLSIRPERRLTVDGITPWSLKG